VVAPNAEMIRKPARHGGFPAKHIAEVKTIIDPTISEG
jgi:hypothetical protein